MKKTVIIVCSIAGSILLFGFLYFSVSTHRSEQRAQQFNAEARMAWEKRPLWKKKVDSDQLIKVGIITDTHVHPSRIDKEDRSPEAGRYLREKYMVPLDAFVNEMASFDPDIVVHLGDVIEGTGDEDYVGRQGLSLVRDELNKINRPVYWVLGNHDLRSVTKEQFKGALDLDGINQVADHGDYRFIVIDTNFHPDESSSTPGHGYIGGYIPDHIFEWLEVQLQTDKRVIVLMHHAALKELVDGKGFVGQVQHLRDLFVKYDVDHVLNGHIETKKYEANDGLKNYSFVGTKKNKSYPGSFYTAEFNGKDASVNMFYIDATSGEYKKINFLTDKKSLNKK